MACGSLVVVKFSGIRPYTAADAPPANTSMTSTPGKSAPLTACAAPLNGMMPRVLMYTRCSLDDTSIRSPAGLYDTAVSSSIGVPTTVLVVMSTITSLSSARSTVHRYLPPTSAVPCRS